MTLGLDGLVVRRTVRAARERLFDAWTTPEELVAWWGPPGVACVGVEIDARVGGRYRIQNRLPSGRVLAIFGEYLEVERPSRLVFTWRTDDAGDAATSELVTVQFVARGADTEVIVSHERIPTAEKRRGHELGWEGCLAGLARHLERIGPRP